MSSRPLDRDEDDRDPSPGSGRDLFDDDFDEDYFDDVDEDEEEDDEDDEEGEFNVDEDGDITFELAGDDDEEGEDEEDDEMGIGSGSLTIQQLSALLNASSGGAIGGSAQSLLAQLLAGRVAGGVTTRSGGGAGGGRVARPEPKKRMGWYTPQRDPNPKGVELLRGGEFGGIEEWEAGWRGIKRVKTGDDTYSQGYERCDGGYDGMKGRSRVIPRSGALQANGVGVKKMSRVSAVIICARVDGSIVQGSGHGYAE